MNKETILAILVALSLSGCCWIFPGTCKVTPCGDWYPAVTKDVELSDQKKKKLADQNGYLEYTMNNNCLTKCNAPNSNDPDIITKCCETTDREWYLGWCNHNWVDVSDPQANALEYYKEICNGLSGADQENCRTEGCRVRIVGDYQASILPRFRAAMPMCGGLSYDGKTNRFTLNKIGPGQ